MSRFDPPSWTVSVAAGARNPNNWLATADSHKRASDILRHKWLADLQEMLPRFYAHMAGELEEPWEPSVGAPAMTLAAFAIENLLKGLAIAADPSLVQPTPSEPDQLFDQRLRTHRLDKLASLAGVSPSTEEEGLLETLTEFVRWAGRYRFPLDAQESAPRRGAEHGGSSFTSDWFPTLDALFDRLRAELVKAALEAGRKQEEAAAEETRRRRPEVIASLSSLRRIELEPGVTVFETDLADEPASVVVCVACGTTLHLNQHRPAAICRCGTLYAGEKRGVAGRVEFAVDQFPAE